MHKNNLHFLCKSILYIVSQTNKVRGEEMKWSEEKGQEEKSLQMLFMEISRHYAGRCFQQIEEL